jgi:type I restriction enzyme S subunit
MANQETQLHGIKEMMNDLILTNNGAAPSGNLLDYAQLLFPQNGEKTPRLRFKGFEDDWKLYRLGDVGTFRSNGVDKKIYPGETIINLLNYMDVFNFRKVTKHNCKDLMQVSASSRQIEECDIKAGDVFFTPSSETAEDIGHVMVMEEDLDNTCYSYHLMRFRPNPGVFYPTFPDYGFQTYFVREQMRIAAKGVQRFVLSKNDFESIMVFAPSFEEQEKIALFFRRLDLQIASQQKQLERLKQMKLTCLGLLFPDNQTLTPPPKVQGI